MSMKKLLITQKKKKPADFVNLCNENSLENSWELTQT